MKKLAILSALMFFAVFVSAQETKTNEITKSEVKLKKKADEEAKLQMQFEKNYQMLSDRAFVVNAEYIDFNTKRYNVNGNINFIKVDSTGCVYQIATGFGVGVNGVGGVTEKGKITTYKLSKNDKRRSCYLNMIIDSQRGPFSVIIDVTAGCNASAWTSFDYGPIIYNGPLVPLREAHAVQGTTPY